ncbi:MULTISPECIES: enoyl-CoA hydratase/isomerase family protein [unclassified Nocardioides]|uniref:enoyl-CoA hydratase/isomerase family protein n=1 Tax=unclassified Nocardioides TaxID=2615069 RepID=UPI000AF3DE94|nr:MULTISPECIES: enoyl-CoA hydratase/isomerase family protein [unclassified Nocardioides]
MSATVQPDPWVAPVRLQVADGVATITLDRPDAMNAVTTALAVALEQALRSAGADPAVRVVLIRGAGGNFCAGGDFEEVQRLRAEGPDALRTLFRSFRDACAAVGEISQPVVAAVEGVAMAGGFELMQACDVVLVRHDARISDNHVNFGMVPGGGGSQRLPRIVGHQRALGLLLSGDRITGVDAVEWGLAYRSYAADSFDRDVEEFVARIASRRPDAVQGIKRLVHEGLGGDLDTGLDLEIDVVVAHIAGDAGGASVSSFAGRKQDTKEHTQ